VLDLVEKEDDEIDQPHYFIHTADDGKNIQKSSRREERVVNHFHGKL
jgi:hypothetical protein